ncbi:alkaline phosphatase family protein [Rhodococcus ruber]|uniref:alkaline phosphatase family protein n=1 Tax=Rhodococcus ruber TaxID=1830 RepID=UPI002657D27A|nr:alkaline phosphatase family protein [Rhodococcus ruber]WKK13290.1 alkaline phosphatase family protein [Rhodococcus ruber]
MRRPAGAIDRRTMLAGTAVLAGAALIGAAPARAATSALVPDADVHVLVVDGMRPDELAPGLTPHLVALADAGTRYTAARAIPVAETLPNHAAMMTGVLPHRNGVPANSVFDPALGRTRDLDRPADLRAATVLDRLPRELGLTTASVLSKRYLHGLFGGRASVAWDPVPLLPLTEHAPDRFTVDALISVVDERSPRFTFTNLGDVDRVGHLDVLGASLRLARTAALRSADEQVARFVEFLRATGRWERSVLMVLADHGMDWSAPDQVIGLVDVLGADPLLARSVRTAQNGGANLLYWVGDPAARLEAVARMREVTSAVPGVAELYAGADLGLGAAAGDLVALCDAGWRFSDPSPLSNPIPGNHGHAATVEIPFFVAGGHASLHRGSTVSDPVRTLDVAPTVAALFGLAEPPGGWDGRAATHAFAG